MTVRVGRPASLVVAEGLLLLIGLSGVSAGITLILAMRSAAEVPWVGFGIGAAVAAYGVVTVVAGIGLLIRRRWAWWLGVISIGAGWLLLVGLVIALGGLDGVFAFGILLWSLTLVCLIAPASRTAATA